MVIDETVLIQLEGERLPAINKQISGYTERTPAHADYFNTTLKQLVDNDATLEADTTQAIKDLRRNTIDMALELELLKGSTLNGMTSNIVVENLTTIDDITLTAGVFDAAGTMLVIR